MIETTLLGALTVFFVAGCWSLIRLHRAYETRRLQYDAEDAEFIMQFQNVTAEARRHEHARHVEITEIQSRIQKIAIAFGTLAARVSDLNENTKNLQIYFEKNLSQRFTLDYKEMNNLIIKQSEEVALATRKLRAEAETLQKRASGLKMSNQKRELA